MTVQLNQGRILYNKTIFSQCQNIFFILLPASVQIMVQANISLCNGMTVYIPNLEINKNNEENVEEDENCYPMHITTGTCLLQNFYEKHLDKSFFFHPKNEKHGDNDDENEAHFLLFQIMFHLGCAHSQHQKLKHSLWKFCRAIWNGAKPRRHRWQPRRIGKHNP